MKKIYYSFVFALCKTVTARRYFDSQVSLDCNDTWALYFLSKCLVKEKKYELAQAYVRHILKISGNDQRWEKYSEKLKEYFNKFTLHVFPTSEQFYQLNITTILYISGPKGVGYQCNMWLKVLERLDEKVAVIIRDKWIAREIDTTSLPVFYISSIGELEVLNSANIGVVLYPGNPQKNIQMLRFMKMQHYFINHGESDKSVNQSKLLRAYDKLLLAGPTAEQRLHASGLFFWPDQIVHVGRPQLSMKLERIYQPLQSIKTVLYAPTWEGYTEDANYTSIGPIGLNILKRLSKNSNIRILFKPHPYTGTTDRLFYSKFLAEMKDFCAQYDNFQVIPSGEDIHKWMNISDLLITDISSVLYDYLYTQKPIILSHGYGFWDIEDLSEKYPSAEAAYVLGKTDHVCSLIDQIAKYDSKFFDRKMLAEKSLGQTPEDSFKRFNQIVSCGCKIAASKNNVKSL